MVMGAVGGAGGAGMPGPPGPMGPMGVQGPPGPMGTIDGNSPLSVHARALAMLGFAFPPNQWTAIDFSLREVDTHFGISAGPVWRWIAPMRGAFHLLASVRLDPGPATPTWQLRVLRGAQLVAEASFTAVSGQIAWLGMLNGQEDLRVQIRPTTTVILALDPLALGASVTIAGVGAPL